MPGYITDHGDHNQGRQTKHKQNDKKLPTDFQIEAKAR